MEKDFICQCNKCGIILIDNNPQVNSEPQELYGTEKKMVYVKDGTEERPEHFWACPNCLSDDYLQDEITIERTKQWFGYTQYLDQLRAGIHGSFAKSISDAWYHASQPNRMKLVEAFPDIFRDRYRCVD